MSLFTRQVSCARIILFAALMLSGCAQPDAAKPTSTPNPDSATAQGPQPLIIWHGLPAAEGDTLQRIAGRFVESNPEIAVHIEARDPSTLLSAYESAVLSGAGPDILLGPMSWVMPLVDKGLIQPVSPELAQTMNDTLPAPVAQGTQIAGTPYALPFSAEFATLYVNRVLVDEPPQIWDQIAPAAQQHGLLVTPTFLAVSGLYFTSGAQLIAADGAPLATRQTVASYLEELHTLASLPGVTVATDLTSFTQGQVGVLLASSNDFANLRAALGEDLSVAALPRIPPKQWSTLLEFEVLMQSLNSTAEATAATGAFAEFILSPDIQGAWFEEIGHAPANPAGLSDGPLRSAWSTTLEWGSPAPLNSRFETEIQPALDRAVQAIMVDGASAEDEASSVMAMFEGSAP